MATRLSASPHNDSSRTITITDTAGVRTADATTAAPERGTIGTLHLRAGTRHQQRVAWDEDVVDNEGCGRKSTKICCIYHKPRNFDESSSEESSSSESDSDSDAEQQHWRHARHPHQDDHNYHHHHHHHQHERERHEGPAPQMRPDQAVPGGVVHQLKQDEDRNAYEIMPSVKGKRKAAS